MKVARLFLLASVSLVAFDAVAAIAARALGFSYSYAAIGSVVLYAAFGGAAARMFTFRTAPLLGAAMGLVDGTAGWAVAWALGPGRLSDGELTALLWMATAVFAVLVGAICASAGGGVGRLMGRTRQA